MSSTATETLPPSSRELSAPGPTWRFAYRFWRYFARWVILFPYSYYKGTAWLAKRSTAWLGSDRTWKRAARRGTHGFLYLSLGLPLTLVTLAEVVITGNEWLMDEQANYRLQSDFAEGVAGQSLDLPGPKTPPIPAVALDPTHPEPYRQYLVELFSPVIIHKMSTEPQWDIPVSLDFDGNHNPRDNVDNEPGLRPINAGVYGELTAETEDSYYLTYSLYHIKDYDHPVREFISSWTFHDNDNEGFHIRVEKQSLTVVEAETWFHNRFLVFNLDGVSKGTEPVHGKLHTEGGTHVVIYAQPQGHGVRCAQSLDMDNIDENTKLLRFRAGGPEVRPTPDRKTQHNVTYDLHNFDRWYTEAQGPFGKNGEGEALFEGAIPLGKWPDGSPIVLGRFIGGRDYAKGMWSRPKPMWSWDDGWDDIPIVMWHFYPSYSFASHAGSDVSHTYLYNRPVELTFGKTADELYSALTLSVKKRGGNKWGPLRVRGGHINHRNYWKAINKKLKHYVNYMFHALG